MWKLVHLSIVPLLVLGTPIEEGQQVLVRDDLAKSIPHNGPIPSFTWDDNQKSAAGIPLLHITFKDGAADDSIELEPSRFLEAQDDPNKLCLFQGHLTSEPNVPVSFNGCPFKNTFNIAFNSKRLSSSMYSSVDGNVTPIMNSGFISKTRSNGQFKDDVAEPDIIPNATNTDVNGGYNRKGAPKAFPTGSTFDLKVSMTADMNFILLTGMDGYVDKMKAVVNLAQNMFLWESLTVKVIITVLEYRFVPIPILADTGVPIAAALTASNPLDANAYSYMSYDPYLDPSVGGLLGVALARHGVCHADRRFRTMISEYTSNELYSAQIWAHEIGHLLHMAHDFSDSEIQADGTPKPRYARDGSICTGIDSIMDYHPFEFVGIDKWSQCSVDDFTDYYKIIRAMTGGFCLSIDGDEPTSLPCEDFDPELCEDFATVACKTLWIQYCAKTCGLCLE